MKYLAIILINFYKLIISPLLPSACIFRPTCSTYAISAIKYYGLVRGMWMALKRISKCHTFGKKVETFTYDPVLDEVADKKLATNSTIKKKS